MKLYELTEAIRTLLASTDDHGGEMTDEQLAQLDALTVGLEHKVETICKIIREDDAEIAARAKEISRLHAGIVTAKNRQKRLRLYLQSCLTGGGHRRVVTNLFKVWLQANPPSAVCLVKPEELPDEFKRVTTSANCQAAINAWRVTSIVPIGFEIRQGESLHIR
jgi:hypothetical protein